MYVLLNGQNVVLMVSPQSRQGSLLAAWKGCWVRLADWPAGWLTGLTALLAVQQLENNCFCMLSLPTPLGCDSSPPLTLLATAKPKRTHCRNEKVNMVMLYNLHSFAGSPGLCSERFILLRIARVSNLSYFIRRKPQVERKLALAARTVPKDRNILALVLGIVALDFECRASLALEAM